MEKTMFRDKEAHQAYIEVTPPKMGHLWTPWKQEQTSTQ